MAFLGEFGQYVMIGGRLVKVVDKTVLAPVYRAPVYVAPHYVARQRVAPSLRVRYGR